jgi:hypothetical protein
MQLTKEQWTRHVEAWRSSGSSAREYCQGRALKVSGLRYWSSRIRREAGQALNETFEGARFAKVRTTKGAKGRVRSSPPSPLLVHVGEVRVEVAGDFDADTLRRVLEVLRSTGGGR